MAAGEDDFFLDDDLDGIPTNTLDCLEQQAVLTSTQRPRPTQKVVFPPTRKHVAHNAATLHDRSSAANTNLPWRPPTRDPPIQPDYVYQPQLSAPPASAPEPPSSDYGLDDDEDVINLNEPSVVVRSLPKAASSRSAYQPLRHGAKAALDPETAAAYAAADAELGSQTFGRWQPQAPQAIQGTSMDVSALRARVAELEAEQFRLRQSETEAREEVRAKQGEISIVRNNHEKSTKQYETRLAVMQRMHAEETAKHKAELESQRKERQKMEINNRFLQHDLAQEAERAKRVHGGPRSTRGGPPTQISTPRKNKRTTLGDGFDEDEIHIVSPSKSKERARDNTPKAGAKRKRPVNDSPAPALTFTEPAHALRSESSGNVTTSFGPPVISRIVQDDTKYRSLQLVMNHRPHEGHERSLEALTKHAFPSKPEKTLASILLDKLARVPALEDGDLAPILAQMMLDLWSKCLRERYFAPLYLILGLLRFAWLCEPPSAKTRWLIQAMAQCTASIDLVARNVVRMSTNQSFAASMDHESLERLSDEIVVYDVLDLLYELSQAASMSDESNELFWKNIDGHFALLMLNKALPLDHTLTMLKILETSARSTSFSVIAENPDMQNQQEESMIDRLTNMLFELPQAPKDEPAYSDEEILHMRIGVLKVMRKLCFSNHGVLLLTSHRSAIGRLVRFLDSQVALLYGVRPSVGITSELQDGSLHELIASTINMTTRTVHHVFRMVQDSSTIMPRIKAVHGGYHKFIISMTRVAFSEELVFEHGIDRQASEAAHEVLDEVLGPEDGDAVMNAVETPRGTRGSTIEKTSEERNFSSQDDMAVNDPG